MNYDSLSRRLEAAQLECRGNNKADVVLRAVDELLSAASSASLSSKIPSDTIFQSIASFTRDMAMTHLNVRHVLLVHLVSLSDPLPFIELIPALFSVAITPNLIEEVVSQLKILLEMDNRLLLPIIGALVDLPLPQQIAPQLAELAENAISVVDESDLPVLFRTLLKSLNLVNPEQTALRLRREMTNLSHETLALVVEAMWEVLPTSSRASSVFLEQIAREYQVRQLVSLPPLADVALILVLSSETTALLKVKAKSILETWLQQGVFPFKQLQLILGRYRRSNEAWDRMIPAIWLVCVWLLACLSSSDGGHSSLSSGSNTNHYNAARNELALLILNLYRNIPAMQENVVSALMGRCYAQSSELTTPDRALGTGKNGGSIPPLGNASWAAGLAARCTGEAFISLESSSRGGVSSGGAAAAPRRIQAQSAAYNQSLLAAQVLELIGRHYSHVGSTILNSLTNRLHPTADGDVLLPSPAISHCLIKCIANATISSPQAESTLLIVIQKLLAAIARTDISLMGLIGVTSRHSSATVLAAPSRAPSRGALYSSTNAYTTGSIGLMLAAHLLHRGSAVAAQDTRAIITWVSRACATLHDGSIIYALDLFVTEMNKIISSSRQPIATSSADSDQRVQQLISIVDSSFSRFIKSQSTVIEVPASRMTTSIADIIGRCHQNGAIATCIMDATSDLPCATIPQEFEARENAEASEISAVLSDKQEVDLGALWCLARLSTDLVDMIEDCDMLPMEQVISRHAAAASGSFWFIQRVSALQAMLEKNRREARSPSAEKCSRISVVGLELSAHPELNIELFESHMQVSTSAGGNSGSKRARRQEKSLPRVVASTNLWMWSCSASESFFATFGRSVGLSVSSSLQLAWERAFTAAFLMGQFQAYEPKDSSHALAITSRLLAQVHASRFMLRAAYAGSFSSSKIDSSSKSRGDVVGGSGARGHANESCSKEEAFSAANKKREGFSVQRCALQRMLNRLVDMLHESTVFSALRAVLRSNSSQTNSDRIDSTAVPSGLLTNTGLALLSCFMMNMWKKRSHVSADDEPFDDSSSKCSESSSNINSAERELINTFYSTEGISDVFLTMQEVAGSTSLRPGSSEELTQQRTLVSRLLSFLPALTDHIEALRKSNDSTSFLAEYEGSPARRSTSDQRQNGAPNGSAERTPTPENAILLGAELDRQGCAVILLILYFLFESVVQCAQSASSGDIGEMACDPVLQGIESPPSSALDSSKGASEEEKGNLLSFNDVEDKAAAHIVRLFTSIEHQVRSSADATLAVAGLRLLTDLSRGTQLSPRCAVLAWTLLSSLYSCHTDLSAHLGGFPREVALSSVPGMDALWPHLAEYVASIPNAETCCQEVQRCGANIQHVKCCLVLMRAAFGLGTTRHSAVTKSPVYINFQSVRVFLIVWWTHESPQSRVFGLGQLLFEAFALLSTDPAASGGAAKTRGTKRKAPQHVDDDDEADDQDENSISSDNSVYKRSQYQRMGNNSNQAFPNLTLGSVDRYLSAVISLLPSLLAVSLPDTAYASAQDKKENSGPYDAIINVIKVFIAAVRGLSGLAEEGEHLKLCAQMSNLIVRCCRALLNAVEVAITNAFNWRNRQPTVGEGSEDVGSMDYLATLLEWSLECTRWIANYGDSLKDHFLLGKGINICGGGSFLAVAKSLTRSLPQLQAASERTAGRIRRIARVNLLELHDLELESDDHWDQSVRHSVSLFVRSRLVALGKPAEAACWSVLPEKGSAGYTHAGDAWNDGDEMDEVSDHFSENDDDDDDDDDDEDDGFAAKSRTGGGGWGNLYSTDPLDDEYSNDQ